MSKIQILLIEDNDDDALMIKELLEADDDGVDFNLSLKRHWPLESPPSM